jgi:hypothetical protein
VTFSPSKTLSDHCLSWPILEEAKRGSDNINAKHRKNEDASKNWDANKNRATSKNRDAAII